MAIDLEAQGIALSARRDAAWNFARGRLIAARERAMARNPRLTPPATNAGGTYTLADGATVTISCSNSGPGSGATFFPGGATRTLADYEPIVLTEGGYRAAAYNNVFAAGAKAAASAWDTPSGKGEAMGRHGVETNAPSVTFAVVSGGVGGAKRMRFIVNGQYLDTAGHALSNPGGLNYVTLAFSSARTRTITLETQWRYLLQTVALPGNPTGYALNRPADRRPRLMIVADSYGIGPAVSTGIASDETLTMQGDGMYQQAADWLGCEGVVNALGGTGFSQGAAGLRYADRWQDVLDAHAQDPIDALHVHGSVNDAYAGDDAATTQARATAYLVRAVQAFPALPITLSGCFPLSGSYAAKAQATETAYAAAVVAAAAQTGSRRLRFVPVQAPAYVPSWQPGGPLVSQDGSHLQYGAGGGHEACGRRIASDLYRAWMAMG